MSWRLQVTHRTGFSYAGPVASSYNEARMSPVSDSRQSVLDARVSVWPGARTFTYRDYWDTQVTSFDVHASHESLEVVADALVETSADRYESEGLDWEATTSPAFTDRWQEFLLATPRTALDDELTDIAAGIRGTLPDPGKAAETVWALVADEITYEPGTTGVQTDAVTVWRQRRGVCQDISHLSVGLLRALGLPARYVSGYLHPDPDAAIGEGVLGQSHAWAEYYDGEWRGFDPTNSIPIGQRHVVVGRGREYGDVPPLKGVYAGPENTGQAVSVTVTRLR